MDDEIVLSDPVQDFRIALTRKINILMAMQNTLDSHDRGEMTYDQMCHWIIRFKQEGMIE